MPRNSALLIGCTALGVWAAWYLLAPAPPFSYMADNWEVSLTMVFGSLIAGGTSEGGGAVAFPVFTKVLHVSPQAAKVFSLAIQSVGMTAAAFYILVMRIEVERRAILWGSLGGLPGILLGAAVLSPHLPADVTKISFTAMTTSFAITLYALNRGIRNCNDAIPLIGGNERLLLFGMGLLGGAVSGIVGTGIDIIVFSMMVLLFRVSEKVATPTSVILMAINTVIGFGLHYFFLGGFTDEVMGYWMAAIPVVVIGAPLGALICSRLSREAIGGILIALIMIELISSLVIIPLKTVTAAAGLGTLALYAVLYFIMCRQTAYEPDRFIAGAAAKG